ncbi:MAG TPA: hypothetical protein VJ010_10460 [Actinomycetota bacterium]|nr:hypothetical protein [Actinomycetota bacterium]
MGGDDGTDRAAAFTSVAEFLELAASSGDLVPGTRGWETLVDVEVMSARAIRANIFTAACEAGFQDNRTGDPPDDRAVSWALHETLNLCRALGLLSVGGGWHDRDYGLTPVGKATALEALRARGTRPRFKPWE